ncbi:response regulator transcription factor [Vallitalea maricola]|uniref:Response regulator transcription factor n=1 Tax=Vallitalea maricola TaxID=3074433 RepID=A0ACB5UM95_9FIRM|nr:response regulator transcription factor [Vallitalea sp. AN17-2]
MIKVILVDDQQLLRESIAYLLENDKEIRVVGMGENGNDAIKLCEIHSPNVVLMDIEMPGLDGVSATKIIKDKFPDIKIIILTTFENPDNIMESFINDADGYIVKNISHKDLTRSIKCVNNGLTVIHKSVKKIMMDRFKGLNEYKSRYKDLLTDREVEIVKLIAAGLSNKEIAAELSFSQGTIKNNISRILEKLDMSDRIQIAIFAIENGIV